MRNNKKTIFFICLALVFLTTIGTVLFFILNKEKTPPKEEVYSVLSNKWQEVEIEDIDIANYFYNIKNTVTKISFEVNSTKTGIDVGETKGTVFAKLEYDGAELVFCSPNSMIYAPSDSSSLFASFTELKEINFLYLGNNAFSTKNVTNFSSFFASCSTLEELNLQNFVTTKAVDFSCMFLGCHNLKFVNLKTFAFNSNIQYQNMFSYCFDLEKIGTPQIVADDVSVDISVRDDFFVQDDYSGPYAKISADNKNKTIISSDLVDAWLFKDWQQKINFDLTSVSGVKFRNKEDGYISNIVSKVDVSANASGQSVGTGKVFAYVEESTLVFHTEMEEHIIFPNNCAYLFANTNFDNINFCTKIDTSFVTNFDYMFANMTNLTYLDISGFVVAQDFSASAFIFDCDKLCSLVSPVISGNGEFELNQNTKFYDQNHKRYNVLDSKNSKTSSHLKEGFVIKIDVRNIAVLNNGDFDLQGDTLQKVYSYDEEMTANYPTAQRDGYTQNALATKNGTIVKEGFLFDRDTTLYFNWDKIEYNLVFNANSANGEMQNQTIKYDTNAEIQTCQFTKTGYKFNSWNTSPNGYGQKYEQNEIISNLFDKNEMSMTLYAQWEAIKYNVVFWSNTQAAINTSMQLTYDSQSKLKENTFTNIGYSFFKWKLDENTTFDDEQVVENLSCTENQTINLYAVWNKNTYHLNFVDLQQDEHNNKLSFTIDDIELFLSDAYKDAYVFCGYYLDASYNKKISKLTIEEIKELDNNSILDIYSSFNVYTYSVLFDANGGSGSMQGVSYVVNQNYNLPNSNFALNGHNFVGWSLTSDGEVLYENGERVKNLTTTNNDIVTLYAVYSPKTYTIIFDDGSQDNQTFGFGDLGTINSCSYIPLGYVFDSWKTSTNISFEDNCLLENLYELNATTINLYAEFSEIDYSIAFNNNNINATGQMDTLQTKYNQNTKLYDNNFALVGYTFAGWSLSADGNVATYSNGDIVLNLTSTNNGVVVLYAVWSAIDYTITYINSMETSSSTVCNYKYDTSLAVAESSFVNTGYEFAYYSYSIDGSTNDFVYGDEILNLTTTNDANITLYAIFVIVEYTITYDYSGGDAPNDEISSYTIETPTFSLVKPSRNGYIFIGWTTSVNSTPNINISIESGSYGNLTFVANWKLV